ncbi:ATP-dependent zinc protease family protein [Thiomicrorhabdus lithotrophica]|uniref:ATP-dependent zinc protease n=1 Tax=Thiomicrorhabdus lithotrophica TaxID=2949997 RepID=A0ABY8C981_9GAMM|nr:ATP-dependent zinc protease [Thiomicrorhabdus lithotrophica]WEJ62528.1 ATP-dependent zinc protease [Thiomicrorhabdus lithotrophica]
MTDVVGWREWVALPDLGLTALKCKVDTGAKNSALHAFEVEEFKKDNQSWVRFYIHIDEDDLSKVQTCEALIQDTREVTDSGGNVTERYFINTTLEIGSLKYVIPVSLTSRDTMAFKMLLGRTALRKAGLLVNPKKSFLQGKK